MHAPIGAQHGVSMQADAGACRHDPPGSLYCPSLNCPGRLDALVKQAFRQWAVAAGVMWPQAHTAPWWMPLRSPARDTSMQGNPAATSSVSGGSSCSAVTSGTSGTPGKWCRSTCTAGCFLLLCARAAPCPEQLPGSGAFQADADGKRSSDRLAVSCVLPALLLLHSAGAVMRDRRRETVCVVSWGVAAIPGRRQGVMQHEQISVRSAGSVLCRVWLLDCAALCTVYAPCARWAVEP